MRERWGSSSARNKRKKCCGAGSMSLVSIGGGRSVQRRSGSVWCEQTYVRRYSRSFNARCEWCEWFINVKAAGMSVDETRYALFDGGRPRPRRLSEMVVSVQSYVYGRVALQACCSAFKVQV